MKLQHYFISLGTNDEIFFRPPGEALRECGAGLTPVLPLEHRRHQLRHALFRCLTGVAEEDSVGRKVASMAPCVLLPPAEGQEHAGSHGPEQVRIGSKDVTYHEDEDLARYGLAACLIPSTNTLFAAGGFGVHERTGAHGRKDTAVALLLTGNTEQEAHMQWSLAGEIWKLSEDGGRSSSACSVAEEGAPALRHVLSFGDGQMFSAACGLGNRAYLIGGRTSPGKPVNHVWEYVQRGGSPDDPPFSFERLVPADATVFPPRWRHGAVAVAVPTSLQANFGAREGLVVIGGRDNTTVFQDVWVAALWEEVPEEEEELLDCGAGSTTPRRTGRRRMSSWKKVSYKLPLAIHSFGYVWQTEEQRMLVFGGLDADEFPRNEMTAIPAEELFADSSFCKQTRIARRTAEDEESDVVVKDEEPPAASSVTDVEQVSGVEHKSQTIFPPNLFGSQPDLLERQTDLGFGIYNTVALPVPGTPNVPGTRRAPTRVLLVGDSLRDASNENTLKLYLWESHLLTPDAAAATPSSPDGGSPPNIESASRRILATGSGCVRKVIQVELTPEDRLLAINHQAVLRYDDTRRSHMLFIIGGGGNCFSFGTHLNRGMLRVDLGRVLVE